MNHLTWRNVGKFLLVAVCAFITSFFLMFIAVSIELNSGASPERAAVISGVMIYGFFWVKLRIWDWRAMFFSAAGVMLALTEEWLPSVRHSYTDVFSMIAGITCFVLMWYRIEALRKT